MDQLLLGDLTINTSNAKLWSPRPDWERLHGKRDDILNQLMSLRAPELQTASGAKQSPHESGIASSPRSRYAPKNTGPLDQRLLAMTFPEFSNSLISALATADLPSSLTAAKQLAGLGAGLTPAGDDFILGAILAAWIIHPPEVARILAEEITNIAAPLTTSLSAAWLRSAGRGEAGILWHEFFDALISAKEMRVQEAIDKIFAMGETSGADALAGFFGTTMFWWKVGATCPS